MDIAKTLDNLETHLSGILSEVPPAEVREFTEKQFVEYALTQVQTYKSDTDAELKKARATHLLENVRVIKAMGGFQDTLTRSIPVFSGPLSVQAQTAWKARSERDIGTQTAVASQAPASGSFRMKSGKPLTAADLMEAFSGLLDAEGSEKDADSGSDDAGDAGAAEAGDTDKAKDDKAFDDDKDKKKKPPFLDDKDKEKEKEKDEAKKADPWGPGQDMNDEVMADAENYGNTGVRSF